ncbi:hypothetical protein HMPREF1624_04091 [Sporothrix schenckii ATCC 58251]|uniref:Uncharacterized protein n=1 Tax=Sporothrix schenckii (strain ATCC 58251 / de Perez 2211183) TaxID=1391915 RepID=U7PW09_SPOS1|nr:hypothetical protein HMPREF1624_04091 [Sporothrix schenckii ATCC 58251]
MTIKVALVGLSTNAVTSWAASAHLPYLLSERGRKRFQIVALLNSSVDAARAAIKHFGLPADTTAAYGKAEALAADIVAGKLEVNFVSVATRVDLHYPVLLPILKAVAAKRQDAPKDFGVYAEWPLAANHKEAGELVDLTQQHGIRTAVGLQGRLAPPYLAVRDVIASGRLGRVLSSKAYGYGGSATRTALLESLGYFADRSVGGNVVTITLGHTIDPIQFVLGELSATNTKTVSQLQRPQIELQKPGAKEGEWVVAKTVTSNVPDLVTVVGTLDKKDGKGAETDNFSDGTATLLVRLARGEPFPGEPAYIWSIVGDKAELRLVSANNLAIQALGDNKSESPLAVKLSLYDYATGEVTDVPWQWQDWQNALEPLPARSIGALYEAYADGREADYATFADAQARHVQFDGWLDEFEKQTQ